MQNKKLPIRKIVSYLNDDEAEGGGFWLPNIQRPFVWNEDQIARLFDSIMREYPISTLLVWKTKEQVKHRKFIDNFLPDLKLTNFYVPDNTRSKMMVLDGQQRLQSLFIGLRGSYFGRELYFDVLSGVLAAPEDIRYRFAFKDKSSGVWPWVRFKDVVFQNNKLPGEIAEALVAAAPSPLSDTDKRSVGRNIERARQEFVNDDINPDSGKRNILHYRAEQRDQIANCMLLTADENGFVGKCDKPPAEWFAPARFSSPEEHEQYLRLHLIPADSSLWALDRYDDFIAARKALIAEKFGYMIQSIKGEAA